MTAALVKSRWQYRSVHRVDSLFKALGIEFRKVKGQDFWEANKAMLPELFQELQTEARSKLRELHPDTGGNGDEFAAFVKVYNGVKHSFALWGAHNPTPVATAEVLAVKAGHRRKSQRIAQDEFLYPSKALDVMRQVRSGLSNRAVARATPHCQHFVAKVRKVTPPQLQAMCPCGRPATHKGWCSARGRPAKFKGNGHPIAPETRALMSSLAKELWAKRKAAKVAKELTAVDT